MFPVHKNGVIHSFFLKKNTTLGSRKHYIEFDEKKNLRAK